MDLDSTTTKKKRRQRRRRKKSKNTQSTHNGDNGDSEERNDISSNGFNEEEQAVVSGRGPTKINPVDLICREVEGEGFERGEIDGALRRLWDRGESYDRKDRVVAEILAMREDGGGEKEETEEKGGEVMEVCENGEDRVLAVATHPDLKSVLASFSLAPPSLLLDHDTALGHVLSESVLNGRDLVEEVKGLLFHLLSDDLATPPHNTNSHHEESVLRDIVEVISEAILSLSSSPGVGGLPRSALDSLTLSISHLIKSTRRQIDTCGDCKIKSDAIKEGMGSLCTKLLHHLTQSTPSSPTSSSGVDSSFQSLLLQRDLEVQKVDLLTDLASHFLSSISPSTDKATTTTRSPDVTPIFSESSLISLFTGMSAEEVERKKSLSGGLMERREDLLTNFDRQNIGIQGEIDGCMKERIDLEKRRVELQEELRRVESQLVGVNEREGMLRNSIENLSNQTTQQVQEIDVQLAKTGVDGRAVGVAEEVRRCFEGVEARIGESMKSLLEEDVTLATSSLPATQEDLLISMRQYLETERLLVCKIKTRIEENQVELSKEERELASFQSFGLSSLSNKVTIKIEELKGFIAEDTATFNSLLGSSNEKFLVVKECLEGGKHLVDEREQREKRDKEVVDLHLLLDHLSSPTITTKNELAVETITTPTTLESSSELKQDSSKSTMRREGSFNSSTTTSSSSASSSSSSVLRKTWGTPAPNLEQSKKSQISFKDILEEEEIRERGRVSKTNGQVRGGKYSTKEGSNGRTGRKDTSLGKRSRKPRNRSSRKSTESS